MLISLPRSYDSICSVIEHSTDLDSLEVKEVVASLKRFKQRLDMHVENTTDRAFVSLNVARKKPKTQGSARNYKFQKNWKNKGNK